MKTRTITAACQKCGEVKMKISPEYSSAAFICITCGEELVTIDCGDYKTISSTCEECKGEIFKAKITIDEFGEETWEENCVSCDGNATILLVDKDLNVIDEQKVNFLILSDKTIYLTETIKRQERIINTLVEDVYNLECKLREVEGSCSDNYDRLDSIKNEIYELDRRIDYLE